MEVTLQSIAENATEIFYQLRWNGEICCPVCGSVHIYGISSHSLARYIQVTQSTAWCMLMKMRMCLGRDIRFDSEDQVAIDEVYIGAQWSYRPSYKKYQAAGEPKQNWNLNEKERKQWYKKRFYELAAEDKMPVLGLVSLRGTKVRLVSIPSSDRQKCVRREINHCFEGIMKAMFVATPTVIVTDQSKLYDFLDDIRDHNNRPKFNHQVCRHDLNKFKSKDGYSSNRLEAAFSHIKRAWRGVYCHWTRLYNQLYLDEFCFRYNNPLSSKTVITDRIKEFFSLADPRVSAFC